MLRIASAQIDCTVGQIDQNLDLHYQMIEDAIDQGASLIVFPEMSITGYCREKGFELAFKQFDSRLERLQELSTNGNIIVIAGAPIQIDNQLYIGSFILYPNKPIERYTKQYLHEGEELYYATSFEYNPTILLKGERIALAICADINNPNHVRDAKMNQATIYIPSIFFSSDGMEVGETILGKYAREHSIDVLMSNYCGLQWEMQCGGRSGFWNSEGSKEGQLDSDQKGLLLVDKVNGKWITSIYQSIES